MSDPDGGDEPPSDPALPPPPPPGSWQPDPDWRAPSEWPAPTVGLPPPVPAPPAQVPAPPPPAPVYQLAPLTRSNLVWETRFVMLAFLLPGVMAAVLLFVEHVAGVGSVTPFPVYITNRVGNLIVGILAYLPVASTVPLALFLLSRSGQTPRTLGLGFPSFRRDIWPGLGLAAAAFGSEFVLLIPLAPLLAGNGSLTNHVATGRVPDYYVIWGLAISLTTAITEEVLVNGYLLTRLEQLGWTPTSALVLSLTLRTSYHVYYGLGFILTIPFGYFVTRSFQKHRRLNRPIAAHFLFDAILFTLSILK
jgi:membrane protease YdiL (CAAX protease family)